MIELPFDLWPHPANPKTRSPLDTPRERCGSVGETAAKRGNPFLSGGRAPRSRPRPRRQLRATAAPLANQRLAPRRPRWWP